MLVFGGVEHDDALGRTGGGSGDEPDNECEIQSIGQNGELANEL